jgi:pimeloyl-ACP methyl ester carboxylesterase
VETEGLRIVTDGVESGRAVVSFTGIGHGLGGVQKEEFGRSLKGVADRVYFVIDKKRSWYNGTHEEIERVMRRELAGFEEVVTLGNSMGGFGALYFAGRFGRCRAAVAFSPQFSLKPGVVSGRDRRWKEYREGITEWLVEDAMVGARAGVERFIFFGVEDRHDRRHARRFLEWRAKAGEKGKGMHVFVVEGCSHDVAAYLKERECLKPLLRGIIHEGFGLAEVEGLFRAKGIGYRCNGVEFSIREWLRGATNQ